MSFRLADAELQHASLSHGTTVFRSAGSGRPVLLLHGYPESHVCWHRIAPKLAATRLVVMPDLPGYGDSNFGTSDDEVFSKRSMSTQLIELMEQLGHRHFDVVGHDRGARVAYRMALDHPDTVRSLTVIDIVPTIDEWDLIDGPESIATFHWPFLAQPDNLPETLLGGAPDQWVRHLISSWALFPDRISPTSLAEYLRCFTRPEVISGTCADYRCGATIDLAHDAVDRAARRMIQCRVLALSSAGRGDLTSTWSLWASSVTGAVLEGGHFLPEENPEAVTHLTPFLE